VLPHVRKSIKLFTSPRKQKTKSQKHIKIRQPHAFQNDVLIPETKKEIRQKNNQLFDVFIVSVSLLVPFTKIILIT
jgi:hypothetical protein